MHSGSKKWYMPAKKLQMNYNHQSKNNWKHTTNASKGNKLKRMIETQDPSIRNDEQCEIWWTGLEY